MTETNQTEVTEVPVVPTLVVDNMYYHKDRIMIAISATTMTPLMDSAVYVAADETTTLLAAVGTPEWCARMAGVRNEVLASSMQDRDQHAWLVNYLNGLKQALLEKAIEKDFCREYDDFAAERDLLPRHREYHVTITLTVQATDEDNARDILENAINLYYVDTISDPEFDVREVY